MNCLMPGLDYLKIQNDRYGRVYVLGATLVSQSTDSFPLSDASICGHWRSLSQIKGRSQLASQASDQFLIFS